jgi:adenylate kinase family enzyme
MKSAIPVIIFLGAPGTGKGTQAMHLSLKKSIPRISTGDMLRHAVVDESDLGRKVQSIMREGALVDDETMLRLVEGRILRPIAGMDLFLMVIPGISSRLRKSASCCSLK